MSTVFGYPAAQPWQGQTTSPFDIKGITQDIERAVSSVPAGKRGNLVVRLNKDGAGAAVAVKGPFSTEILGTILKPTAGRFEWSVQGKVSFIKGSIKLPVRVAPEVRGWYRVFRRLGHGPIRAAFNAVRLAEGVEVSIG